MNVMERRRRWARILVLVAVSMALPPSLAQAPDAAACSDGVDNDADGAADWPSDVNCQSAVDESEEGAPPACWDGVDNDGDGRTDYPRDTDCASLYDESEAADPTPAVGLVHVDVYPGDPSSPCAADVCLDWLILMAEGHLVEMHLTLDSPCGVRGFVLRVPTAGLLSPEADSAGFLHCGTGTALVLVFVDGQLYAADWTSY